MSGSQNGAAGKGLDLPTLIGGLAALIALAAGIIYSVDPLAMLWRAALAFLLGSIATQLWYVFFTVRVSGVNLHHEAIAEEYVETTDAPAEAA